MNEGKVNTMLKRRGGGGRTLGAVLESYRGRK